MEKLSNLQEPSPTKHIAQKLLSELVRNSLSISFVEGCTGGNLNSAITIPGSTKVFHMGLVLYSQSAKTNMGVPLSVIDKYGEYSPEVALSMVQVAQKQRNDDLIISTIGELTSSQPYCHVVYSLRNKPPIIETIKLKPGERVKIKSQLSELILSHAYSLIKHGVILLDNNKNHLLKSPLLPIATDHKAQLIVDILASNGLRISTMESCTGGEIASRLTNINGSSQVVDSALIAYDENVKQTFGVPFSSMYNGGVYSEQVAIKMAEAAMRLTGSDITIGTTGTMESMDFRPYHNGAPGKVYVAINIRNRKPVVITMDLRPTLETTREQLKTKIVNQVFDSISNLLNQSFNEFSSSCLQITI